MSKNIYKSSFVRFEQGEAKIINSDELVQKRMEMFTEMLREREHEQEAPPQVAAEGDEDGGLDPEALSQLTGDPDAEDGGGFVEGIGAYAADISDTVEPTKACDDLIAEANAQASAILAEANAEAVNIREKAAGDGYREGYEKGMEQAGAELEAKLAELEAERERMAADYEAMLAEAEPRMVEVITSVYAKVFSEGFYNKKDVLVALLSKALSNAETDDRIVIHVSDEDYETVSAAKDELFAGLGLPTEPEIRPRESLSAGQCKVETAYGIMDCSVDTELKELEKALVLLSHS